MLSNDGIIEISKRREAEIGGEITHWRTCH